MISLNSRLLIAASIVLAAFLGLTGVTLDKVFCENAENAVQDRLEGHVYTLIAATIIGEDEGLQLPDHISFSNPLSELFAQAISNDAKKIWRSPSMIEQNFLFRWALPPVTSRFEQTTMPDGLEIFVYSLGVTWDESEDVHDGYTFSVGEKKDVYDKQVQNFREKLWGWLIGVALVLLAVQSVILRWGLTPLRRVINDLQAIESGQQTQLEGAYPKELKGLTDNLNKLINNERDHLARYRNTLGNLAHSLKTPLAVLRGEVENSSENDLSKRTMSEQVNRMSQIVEYQLQRAATSGRSAITARVKTLDVVSKIINALNKVYADKDIIVDMQVDESSRFQGDEGDLMEMLGNLLDNAYKCCENQVRVSSKVTGASKPGSSPDFELFVEDDGPGMHEDQIEKLLERGVRGDLDTKGHGIGLAMVNEIIEIYSGTLSIDKSDLGGSRIKVHIPSK